MNGTLNISGTLDINHKGVTENTGNVYGKSFYANMNSNILDTTNYFSDNKDNGFNYQYYQYSIN